MSFKLKQKKKYKDSAAKYISIGLYIAVQYKEKIINFKFFILFQSVNNIKDRLEDK